MSLYTQWRCIVGWTPTHSRPPVVEQLSCGHEGKRSELYRVEQRIAEGRTRLCLRCTDEVRTESVAVQRQAVCRTKIPYSSRQSAQAAAQRLGGRAYACKACRGWHLTTA